MEPIDLIVMVIGIASSAFALGFIVGDMAARHHRRRMSDLQRRRNEIVWPAGHNDLRSPE